jgi:pyruvate kinase
MLIRTKIIATVGPASADPSVLRRLVEAGADLFRINFSHGVNEDRIPIIEAIRAIEREVGRPIGIFGDLCGPKIRVGEMAGDGARLEEGRRLVIQRAPVLGTAERISTTLAELVDQARPGQMILLDDGKLRLEVVEAGRGDELICRVRRGGRLTRGKGVNLPQTRLALSPLTEKDHADLAWIAAHDFDYIAQSFVCAPEDIEELRARLTAAGRRLPIIAKIEKPQAMERIEDIVAAADAVMVARGDLGVEMDLPAVPVAQKTIARQCALQAKPCIIATQMLESMTEQATPTRAEVSDVANAVLDHADAVMLSGETAVGRYPAEAVAMMNDIVSAIQSYHDRTRIDVPIEPRAGSATAAALADSIRQLTARQAIAAVAVFTLTGHTARLMAKQRPDCPILGLSPDPATVRRLTLYYGVVGHQTPMLDGLTQVLTTASDFALRLGIARPGDKLAVISGQPFGIAGLTNTLVVHSIE